MHVEPQVEHNWLENLVGKWNMEAEMDMGPDKPQDHSRGVEYVRQLGDVWVICEGEWENPGGGVGRSMMTLGFDTNQKSFVGSFVGSMMTHLWTYDRGSLDDAGRVLTLNSTGPNFSGQGMSQYQDIIEIVDVDHRVLRSQVLDENEVWQHFMTANYTRQA